MRALLAVAVLFPALVLADVPGVHSPPEAIAPPASALDSVRLFNSVEAYRLEPSDVRAEVRFLEGMPGTEPTMEVRAEVGVTRHFQLNLAEDISAAHGGGLQPTATPVSLRYTLGSEEDDILFNPAIEAVVTPRPNAPARAGVRLLLAEEVVPRLVVAANGYLEQNLDRGSPAGVDGALGMAGGVSYALVRGHVRLGAEGQLGAAQYGAPGYSLALAAGPTAALSLGPVAATLSGLVDLTQRRIGFEPMVTLGSTF